MLQYALAIIAAGARFKKKEENQQEKEKVQIIVWMSLYAVEMNRSDVPPKKPKPWPDAAELDLLSYAIF